MSRPTADEPYGLVTPPYGVAPDPAPYGTAPAPAPYGVAPATAPYGAGEPPRAPQAASTRQAGSVRRAMADELRHLPRQMGHDLWQATLELLVEVGIAAVVVGIFALVGYAIGGSLGALLGGLLGFGAFLLLRFLLLAGVVTWAVGSWLLGRRRSR